MRASVLSLALVAVLISACTGGATQVITVTAPAPDSAGQAEGGATSAGADASTSPAESPVDTSAIRNYATDICDITKPIKLTGNGSSYGDLMSASYRVESFQAALLRQDDFASTPYAQEVADATALFVAYAEWLQSKAIEAQVTEMLVRGDPNYEWPKDKDSIGSVEGTISIKTGAAPPTAGATVEQEIALACAKVPSD